MTIQRVFMVSLHDMLPENGSSQPPTSSNYNNPIRKYKRVQNWYQNGKTSASVHFGNYQSNT